MKILYNVNFINPFLDAVVDVLGTMAQIEARPGKPYINGKGLAVGDVTGLIGVTGHGKGSISLSLEQGAILAIVNSMLMESYTEINADIVDAVGELTNMVAGQARKSLAEQGMKFQASTPTVVVGKGHKVQYAVKAPILAIPFSTDKGNLVVEVCFADSEADAGLQEG